MLYSHPFSPQKPPSKDQTTFSAKLGGATLLLFPDTGATTSWVVPPQYHTATESPLLGFDESAQRTSSFYLIEDEIAPDIMHDEGLHCTAKWC